MVHWEVGVSSEGPLVGLEGGVFSNQWIEYPSSGMNLHDYKLKTMALSVFEYDM